MYKKKFYLYVNRQTFLVRYALMGHTIYINIVIYQIVIYGVRNNVCAPSTAKTVIVRKT